MIDRDQIATSAEEPSIGRSLRPFTPARVGLTRAGSAISTADQLQFQLDHARARDAVHDTADFNALASALRGRNLAPATLESAVTGGRRQYLRRPDLGRILSATSAEALRSTEELRSAEASAPGTTIIVADGLSALAVDRHALSLLDALLPGVAPVSGPICLVRNGRVAVGDEIGAILNAQLTILLIGERPGLSAPDSLGVYLTSDPRPGRTDAERNCISNIRPPDGLGYAEAARRILFYITAARALGGTGYRLKEPSSPNLPAIG